MENDDGVLSQIALAELYARSNEKNSLTAMILIGHFESSFADSSLAIPHLKSIHRPTSFATTITGHP